MLAIFMTWLLGAVAPLEDLAADAARARHERKPIVLYVSRSDCTFCRRFEQDVLAPLLKSGRFDGAVLYRELVMDAAGSIIGMDGHAVTPTRQAQQLGVIATPTVFFLDGNGRALVRPKVGYDGNEFASFYLERSIALAIERVTRINGP